MCVLFVANGCTLVENEKVYVAGDEEVQSLAPGVFLNKIPVDDFENLTLEDFPTMQVYYNWPKVGIWNGRLFFLSFPHVIEYNWDGEIIAYTDLDKVQCSTDMELVGDDLFVMCREVGLYQIDLNTNQITNFYDRSDGLKSLQNPDLGHSGDVLWMGTFDGVAKIYPESGEVVFYDDLLGIPGKLSSQLYARGGEVWVTINANAYSSGYALRYNGETDSWDKYDMTDLGTEERGRLDFDEFILADEEVFVAVREENGPQKIVLKKFNQETDTWDEVYYAAYVEFNENYEAYLPDSATYEEVAYNQSSNGGFEYMEIYDGKEWVDIELDIYSNIAIVGDGTTPYYILGTDGIYSFAKKDRLPKKVANGTNKEAWAYHYSEFFMDAENKYVVAFSASINDMGGGWYGLSVGVYDIENDSYFEDYVDFDEYLYPENWETGFEISEPEFDYENGMISFEVVEMGDVTIDLGGEIMNFKNN